MYIVEIVGRGHNWLVFLGKHRTVKLKSQAMVSVMQQIYNRHLCNDL